MSSRSVAIRVPLLLALACVCACAHPAVRQTPSGVGVALVERGERPLVVELVPGGPAEAAGIAPGDALLSVDGRTTEGLIRVADRALYTVKGDGRDGVRIGSTAVAERDIPRPRPEE